MKRIRRPAERGRYGGAFCRIPGLPDVAVDMLQYLGLFKEETGVKFVVYLII